MSQSSSRNPMSSTRRTPTKPGDKISQLLEMDLPWRVRYTNTLPDLPYDGKFLPCPFVSLQRFVDYKPCSVEKDHKWQILGDADNNVHINLIDPETYAISSNKPPLHEADAELLEDDTGRFRRGGTDHKRSAQHSKVVPWMRKTEYISSDFNRFGVSAERHETKVGYGMMKRDELDLYQDRASQIAAIQKTFEDVKKPAGEHWSKKGVYAVEERPILPDFDWWRHPFAQVIFDADPALAGLPEEDRKLYLDQGNIRGMQDEDGHQFVAYFTPTAETMQRRLQERADGVHDSERPYEHVINREYNWDVKNKATKGYEVENYFFTERDGFFYYNELETRVKLTRRRQYDNKNSRMMLTLVDPSPADLQQQESRLNSLLQPYREDDSAEESAEEYAKREAVSTEGDSDEGGVAREPAPGPSRPALSSSSDLSSSDDE